MVYELQAKLVTSCGSSHPPTIIVFQFSLEHVKDRFHLTPPHPYERWCPFLGKPSMRYLPPSHPCSRIACRFSWVGNETNKSHIHIYYILYILCIRYIHVICIHMFMCSFTHTLPKFKLIFLPAKAWGRGHLITIKMGQIHIQVEISTIYYASIRKIV